MKLKKITATQKNELKKLVGTKLLERIKNNQDYLENESEWFIERCEYIVDLAVSGKVSPQLSEDIEARIKNVERAQENRISQNLDGSDVEEISIDGLANVIAKHIILVNIERIINGNDIDVARAQGDLSENAEYDAAREKQAEIEKEIVLQEQIIERAQLLDLKSVSLDTVSSGTQVTYEKKGGKSFTFAITGSTDSNPDEGKISKESEVAKAMLGHKVGDSVVVRVRNPYEITIKKIERAK